MTQRAIGATRMRVYLVELEGDRRVPVAARNIHSAISLALEESGVPEADIPQYDRTGMLIRPIASGGEWQEGVLPQDDLLWDLAHWSYHPAHLCAGRRYQFPDFRRGWYSPN